MNSLSITTIILTYNEEKHIRRCVENVYAISEKIYVIDSFSTDATSIICSEYSKVEFVQHAWPGNQADQFNWALLSLPIKTEWILRLDADEFMSESLIREIYDTLPGLPISVSGCVMKRDVIFAGKRIRFGKMGNVSLLRLWRKDKAFVEKRLMDEHVILKEGDSIKLKHYFFDDNINGVDSWLIKHMNYASREAEMIVADLSQAENGRDMQKNIYYIFPKYVRGFLFFVLRYVILWGFLDGKPGFLWHFLQCFWYRTLVDIKIEELSKKSELC